MDAQKCPRCGSSHIKKRETEFDTGNAAAGTILGGALLGPLGAIGGAAAGSGIFKESQENNSQEYECLDCGRHFWPQAK